MPEFNEENVANLFNSAEGDGAAPENAQTAVQKEVENPVGMDGTEEMIEPRNEFSAASQNETNISTDDLKRLENMGLDGIIDDVTSEKVSVSDLFGGGAESRNAVREVQENSEMPEKKAGKDRREKKEKKKNKKKDKSFFKTVKKVFFESLEEELPPPEGVVSEALNVPPKNQHEKKKKEEVPAKQTSEETQNTEADENKLDENERLLQEMYGDGQEEKLLEENIAPKKGFFAKLKYRFQQMKKKNAEEDLAEQEAEAQELEEKQKKKEEKQTAVKEKKEAAREAKEAKKQQKPEKPQKEKKEKKPKSAPKPGDILKIKPKSILLFTLFIAGIVVLISVLNWGVHYSNAVSSAKAYMENQNYEKAYEALSGMKLNKNDQIMYRQSSVIMYVERQYSSYQNYVQLNMRTEALNALVKGIERYDTYYNEAKELGVEDRLSEVKGKIVKALQETFKISEAEARSLVTLSYEDFIQYYNKIQSYGEAR